MNDALRPADRPRPAQFAHLLAHSLSILGVALNGWRHPLPLPSPPTHAFFLRSWSSGRLEHTHSHATESPRNFQAGRHYYATTERGGNGMEKERERERVLRTMQRIFYDERTNERSKGWVRKTTATAASQSQREQKEEP